MVQKHYTKAAATVQRANYKRKGSIYSLFSQGICKRISQRPHMLKNYIYLRVHEFDFFDKKLKFPGEAAREEIQCIAIK